MQRLALFPCVGLLVAVVHAQERLVVVGPEPAMLRLGDTARAEIRIEDPTGNPRQFRLPDVDGLRLQLFGPSQQMNQVMDGRSIVTKHTLSWTVEMQPSREGAFVVPPFPVWTGSKQQLTRELRLEVKKDLRGEELGYLDVAVAPSRVYVHEPIRVSVDAGVQQGLRLVQGRANNGQGYFDVEVQASWLDEFPAGESIAVAAPAGGSALIVKGGNSLIAVGHDEDHERNGQHWRRFSFERAFLPTRIGKISLAAPTLRYHVVRQPGRQDLFGLTRGGVTEQYYVYGKPVEIEVLPIPEAGRPTPFFGAVGRFTIEAALDRDTVRVGNSVKLTLTVRGQGNLGKFLRLPTLDELAGFHKLGQAEARRDAEKVVTTYDLVPLSTDVRQVPAIDWNFFDTTPGVEKFVLVATKPLALQVQALANGETLAPLPASDKKAVTPGVDDIFDLPALTGEPAVAATVSPLAGWLAVLLPWGLAFAVVQTLRRLRARAADVVGQRARGAARAFAAALQRGEDPLAALAGYLGDRLGVAAAAVIAPDLAERLAAAGVDDESIRATVAAIDRGTAARYGGGAGLASDEVRALVQRLDGLRFGVMGWLPLWLLPLLAAGIALDSASAQQTPPAPLDPIALYRAGDYAAADAAFAKAHAATGDRRLLQARGNCSFRQGELARALWAYESARLALPREPELLANIELVRSRLELDAPTAGFLAELDAVRKRLTPREQMLLCSLCMVGAASCLVFGWRRTGLRWVGALVAVPGLWLAFAVLVQPAGKVAIALEKLALVSEPRSGLEPIATVRPGVAVAVLGGNEGTFVKVAAGDRIGYAARSAIALVE